MATLTDVNLESAINDLSPEVASDLARRARAGETFTKDQIIQIASEEPGVLEEALDTSLGFLGDILGRISTVSPKAQAVRESNPEFWEGKEVADPGSGEWTGRGILREAPSALGGLGLDVGGMYAGREAIKKLIPKTGRYAPLSLLGMGAGAYLTEKIPQLYGAWKGQLPWEALSPTTDLDAMGNLIGQLVGTEEQKRYARGPGPKSFQDLPGVSQDLGTFTDWTLKEPIAAGLLMLGAKGGKAALKKSVDLTAPAAERPTSPAAEAIGKISPIGEVEGALASDPKYREMAGKKVVSWFSGTGTMEAGLPGVKSVRAVEFDPVKIDAYNRAHGTDFSPSSVLDDQAIADLKKADPDLFHASPECKAFSTVTTAAAREKRGCLDMDFVNAIIKAIKVAKPKNISLENAPGYKTAGEYEMVPKIDKKTGKRILNKTTGKPVMTRVLKSNTEGLYYKKIIKALDDEGYSHRTDKANVADYGGAASRDRLYIRASRVHDLNTPEFDLPPMSSPKNWWEEIKDLIPGAKVETDNWRTLKSDNGEPLVGIESVKKAVREGKVTDTAPIWYNGDGSNTRPPAVKNIFSHKTTPKYNKGDVTPIPAIVSSPQKARILMPDGRSILVTPRMLARLQGLPDSFKIPGNFYDAKAVVGNGMHTIMTDLLIRPMLAKTPLSLVGEGVEGGTAKLAVELGEAIKVQDLDFIEGAKNFTPTQEGLTTGVRTGKGRFLGAIHRQLDNILNVVQKIEGVGGDEFLRKALVDVGLDGVSVGGKKIGGQLSFEAATAAELQEFAEKATNAGIFRYLEIKKFLKTRNVKDFLYRKSALSEARSRRIVEALESVEIQGTGKLGADDLSILRRDLGEALKERPLRNANGDIMTHKGKPVLFGGESAVDLATFMAKNFREKIVDINAIRVALGNNAINMLPGYFPHMHRLNRMEDLFESMITVSDEVVEEFNKSIASGNKFSDYPWFGSLLHRATDAEDYSRSIIDVFQGYNRGANKIIHNAIPARVVRQRVEYLANTGKLTNDQATIFTKWIDEGLLGKSTDLDKWIHGAPLGIPTSAYWIKRIGDRFARNILVGSSSFMLNNISSLAQVVASAGLKDTLKAVGLASPDLVLKTIAKKQMGADALLKGMAWTGNRMGMDFALKHSKVMQNRIYTGYEEIGREALGRGKIYGALSSLIDTADQWNVAVSFNANYMAAIKRGVPHEKAVRFADDMAYKNQAIYSAAYKPQLLRSRYLSSIAPFQTWINNLNSFVRNEIIGGRMAGPGASGLRRLAGEADKEFFDALSPTDKLGVSIKFAGSVMAINGFMVAMGMQPPYDTSSFFPFEKQVEGALDVATGSGYGRTDTLFIGKPIREVLNGLGELAWGDSEGLEETINDPQIREAIRAALNLALPYGGTQLGRIAEGLGDMYQGFMPVTSPMGGYTEAPFGGAENKSILPFPEDYFQAPLFGPRRSSTYLEERYPDTGYYEPRDPGPYRAISSMLEGLMVPQRMERQKERFDESEALQRLFSILPGIE